MKLSNTRLYLRPWEDADAPALYQLARNPEIGPRAGWPPHSSEAESLEIIQNFFNNEGAFAILAQDSHELLGSIALKDQEHSTLAQSPTEGELGFWIGQPFWGHGYAGEAASLLIDEAFNQRKLSTIWCAYFDGNASSKRVQEKLGFHYAFTIPASPVPMLQAFRTRHVNRLDQADWQLRS
ncbi:RimJ/RimL family protein N-acetyltransferase [Suicoccus acidiformans]|uniref:RimJ/RimL family protein N-acetyltransferase n=1 Tax=Suicoccus acidiformans TaxID=2036206 RepID=A0A347WKM0_9LACT|nr:GNAT family N-acetyltransferase [Suicoccus acidiformans]AXY25627.1 RimJ/RimL family protein N-acetyltransferase [Suicoccus acidiformans]